MDDKITLKDIRVAIAKKICCISGLKLFLKNNNFDWSVFKKEGIPVADLEKLNDAVVNEIIKIHKERK